MMERKSTSTYEPFINFIIIDEITTYILGVNCGGGAVDGLAADQSYTSGSWGCVNGLTGSQNVHGNTGNYPNACATFAYQDPSNRIKYSFTVPNGDYKVTLGFYDNLNGYDTRISNIYINNNLVEGKFDATKYYGWSTCGTKSYTTAVNGTTLDIVLERQPTSTYEPFINFIIVEQVG